jgi:hypothetical protein
MNMVSGLAFYLTRSGWDWANGKTCPPLPNEGVAVQAVSPGRVPGYSAVYKKQIDAAGKTIRYTKTTYDPVGNIVRAKDKINGGVFP